MRSKIEIIVKGVLVPFVIYVGITFFVVTLTSVIFKDNEKVNAVLKQGIANLFLAFILIPYYLSFRNHFNVKSREFAFRFCLFMIPLAFSVCILCNIFIAYMPNASENKVSKEVFELMQNYNIGLSLFIVGVLVPIVEEILFRGLFYDATVLISNDIVAIILASLAFAFAHGNIEQGIYAFIAGIFLAYVKFKYKRVIYTIIMHLLMNVTTLVIVPSILEINSFKEKMFIAFIAFAILILTIIRMNYIRNISDN